jgi:hypothetical protein
MPENKLSSEQNEELRVQVTLAIYQTDISTQTTTMFGASALLFEFNNVLYSASGGYFFFCVFVCHRSFKTEVYGKAKAIR